MTFVWRQTACEMRLCCARRIVETGGRRGLVCTSTRWAERHPQGVCRIRKAAEPPTAAQQRVAGAEANRIAASNAAPPRYGQCNRQALQLFELLDCNGNFLWEGAREGYLFSKKRYPSLIRVLHTRWEKTGTYCSKRNRAIFSIATEAFLMGNI